MNTRFVTFVLLLFVWLEGNSVWAQYLPKLYQVFSPDKKLVMAIQWHNDGLLTYTFAGQLIGTIIIICAMLFKVVECCLRFMR